MTTTYLSGYGVQHTDNPFSPGGLVRFAKTGFNGIRNLASGAGDYFNYLEFKCQEIDESNFQEKLKEFKTNVLSKIKKHDPDIHITIDCLLKNGSERYDSKRKIAQLGSYNNDEGFDKGDFGYDTRFSGKGGEIYNGNPKITSFDEIIEGNKEDMWKLLKETIFVNNNHDSLKLVISKQGLKDYKDNKLPGIDICNQETKTGGRRHSSRKYKKTTNRVKSAKRRSHSVKSHRTRRQRK